MKVARKMRFLIVSALSFLLPTSAFALDCSPLEPSQPVNETTITELKASAGGLVSKLVDGEIEAARTSIREDVLLNYEDSTQLAIWNRLIYLTCEVINEDNLDQKDRLIAYTNLLSIFSDMPQTSNENNPIAQSIDFSGYDVGRRAREFGSNIVIKKATGGQKYATGRVDGTSFSIDNLSKNTSRVSFDLFSNISREREFKIQLSLSDGKKVDVFMGDPCCNWGAIDIKFEGAWYNSREHFSWRNDNQNSITFELNEGDLSLYVNGKFINLAVVNETASFESIVFLDFTTKDAIFNVEISSI